MRYVAVGFGMILTFSFATSSVAVESEPAFAGSGKT